MRPRVRRTAWVAAALASTAAAAFGLGALRHRQAARALERRIADLGGSPRSTDPTGAALPAPVARYLQWALPAGADLAVVRLRQEGVVRTGVGSHGWMPFTATHVAAATAPGFVWNARVAVAPLVHVRIVDSFADGIGSGRVHLLSAIPVSADAGTPEMNAGALHRYLAEAPWYPTALRPSDRLTWTAIDDTRALATLREGGITVSLEFRFDESGAISGIYTPARWGSFAGGYRQHPWEGHFRRYVRQQGIAIPTDADVGWYVDGPWQPVWKGRITGFEADVTR